MKKKYEELLASLEQASAQARAIHVAGGPTDRIYRTLATPIREVKDRLAYIRDAQERDAETKKADASAEKAAAEPTAPAVPVGTVPKPN